jgi:FixJ family two-component response regulator
MPHSPTPRQRVYVVEDDASALKAIDRLLIAYGFETELFDSAEAFLRRANVHGALCVVIDINLSGISGIELGHRLAHLDRRPPIIFVTANDDDALRKTASELGPIAYLLKPFSAQSLATAISAASAAGSRAS